MTSRLHDLAPYELGPAVLDVVVPGLPIGQGQLTALGPGRPVVHSNARLLKPWRRTVATMVRAQMRGTSWPIDGPVAVDLTFTMPRPARIPRGRAPLPDRRPDLDHLIRAVLDAMSPPKTQGRTPEGAGAIADDARAVEITARKVYPAEHPLALAEPGARIRLHTVTRPEVSQP